MGDYYDNYCQFKDVRYTNQLICWLPPPSRAF